MQTHPIVSKGPHRQIGRIVATLEGTLERIVFRNEENSWTVARIREESSDRLRTAVGKIPGVNVGESVRFEGKWIQNPKFGEQLQISSYEVRAPVTESGIEKYLASGLVKGIGPEMAKRVVERFGEATLDVIDSDPGKLLQIDGIGPKRVALIREGWAEQRSVRSVMIFLQDLPIGPGIAARIYQTYKDRTVEVVQNDPYRLAEEVFLVGFQTADRIAQSLGIEKTSPRRAEAGLLHMLTKLGQSGHVCYPREDLVRQAAEFLELDEEAIESAVVRLQDGGTIVIDEIAADGEAVYRTEMADAEIGVAARLIRLIEEGPGRRENIDSLEALRWAEQALDLYLGNDQKEAVEAALEENVVVVTGGPGTGKTTLVRSLLAILQRTGDEVKLAAPTGRAAKKLEEATGCPASTIHRLLEFDPRTATFQRDEKNPLTATTLIVDEVSMVDLPLMFSLLVALQPECRLVLVGDVDQLPSVGPGNVLRDLIHSSRIKTVFLREIYRQARESRIIVNAHRVNEGRMPELGKTEGDFRFIELERAEDVLERIRTLFAEEIYKEYGFDSVRDVQLLAPMNKGLVGVLNLNRELQLLLNPAGPEVKRDDKVLRIGDKVMQIRNNYEKDVFNGDVGRIMDINPTKQEVHVRFGPRTVTYPFSHLDELTLAYAISVHKSQGSEYRGVVIPLLGEHYPMLQRNLLYTGLTRGRELVILIGTRRTVSIAVRNDRIASRFSFLAERIRRG